MNLLELVGAYAEIQRKIEDGDWKSEGFQSEAEAIDHWVAQLEGVGENLYQKVENIEKLIENLRAEAQSCLDLSNRLKSRAARLQKAIERLREYEVFALSRFGINRVRTVLGTVSLVTGKSVEYEEEEIPDQFWVLEKRLDKKKLRELALAGEDIPGVKVVDRYYVRRS